MADKIDVLSCGKQSNRRIVWLLVGLMLLSFVFGIAMFLPAEHRAQKIQQMEQRYQ
ncbi:MAG: hypothetical protein QF661_13650 [Arenicellales bacterium]|nr:hypothetical protein [Arenicellales bacterium]